MSHNNIGVFYKSLVICSLFTFFIPKSKASIGHINPFAFTLKYNFLANSLSVDSTKLKYPIKDTKLYTQKKKSGIDLGTPPSIKRKIQYNPKTKRYDVYNKIGGVWTKSFESYSFEEYAKQNEKKMSSDYFSQRSKSQSYVQGGGIIPKLPIPPGVLSKIFGDGPIDIQPNVSAELTLGANFNTVLNPNFSRRMQRNNRLDFQNKLQINVKGKIGDKVDLGINYDTETIFEFDNQTNLDWEGKEDDIIKMVELGNISMPLDNSLISGVSNLYGAKTTMQFGPAKITSFYALNKGQKTQSSLKGGVKETKFNIQADQYDMNKHFFMGHSFRDDYDNALSTLPIINSSVIINRVEVWVTNFSNNVENTRDIIAFQDIGENKPFLSAIIPTLTTNTANSANTLYDGIKDDNEVRTSNKTIDRLGVLYPKMEEGLDYYMVTNARQLNASEFTFHPQLGFISLKTSLNDDAVLGIAYEYTYRGKVYKVGEFASEVPRTTSKTSLYLKLLKGKFIRTRVPIWDLMMKNIYSLNTYNLNTEDLKLNVIYADDASGADLNYLPVNDAPQIKLGTPLLTVFNMDRLNRQNEAKPDGKFDAIEGITVLQQDGKIIFPLVEPFGNYLEKKLDNNKKLVDKYVFKALYDSTKFLARQDVFHNKFFIRGVYKGKNTAEIMIGGFNIPRGSVKVTANGQPLTEGQDYNVDYNIGRVTIINQALLESGANITASAENNTPFSINQKTMVGTRLDYTVNRKAAFGATVMHMYERPITPKVNYGEEPIKNTMIGFDGSFSTDSRLITRLVDKIPFIQTKEKSKVNMNFEFAKLFTHKPKSLNNTSAESYIDDFEGAESPYELKNAYAWHLSSVPQKQLDLYPETEDTDKMRWLDHKAKLAFYQIDQTYYRNETFTPQHIKDDLEMLSDARMRQINLLEYKKQKNLSQTTPNLVSTLDMAFYPKEKGQYNFNASIADVDADGFLKNPKKSWGGITREITTSNFESANIAYLEVWVMDPFKTSNNPNGNLYLQIGSISEDLLPDRNHFYENGLSGDGTETFVDSSTFGRIPTRTNINKAFTNENNARPNQDLGLDGLKDEDERTFFKKDYLDKLEANFGLNSNAYQNAFNDPSNDNYKFHRDDDYTNSVTNILGRYRRYNQTQGNSTLDKLSDGTPKSATVTPDDEDIDRDFTVNQSESYYQYKIPINTNDFEVGKGYVADKVVSSIKLPNGENQKITWYQLKIPIHNYEKAVGNISDFRSIQYMRMVMNGFSDTTILRFAEINMIRADWRVYDQSLNVPGIIIPQDPNSGTIVGLSTVNVEENSTRTPLNYIVPPGIIREIDQTNPTPIEMNEQSISMNVCELKPSEARAIYKTTLFDLRNYKTLKMFTHIEGDNIKDGDLSVFMRIGTDLSANYYEYELPLKISPKGDNSASSIWPEENQFDIDIASFTDAKQARRKSGGSLNRPYLAKDDNGKITVMGLPDMSNIRVVMLGIRNNSDTKKCFEAWFNELRVKDYVNQGGWAAVARVNTQLADLGNLTANGSIKTIGFGGIDQKLNDRSLSNDYQYDINASLQLGKFFGVKSGVNIPFFIGWNETFNIPKFDPLNPDLVLDSRVLSMFNKEKRDALNEVMNYTSRYSLNFTNIKKNRTNNSKPHIWDIENFNLSYSYLKVNKHDMQIEDNFEKTWKGGLGYAFTPKIKSIEPFKKLIKGRKFRIIKDINLNLIPNNLTARLDINRFYSELLNRNNDNFKALTPRFYDKNFTMNRFYTASLPLTKSIKIDYNATVNSRVEEPFGNIDTEAKKDTINNNIKNFGDMNQFDQTLNASYTLPFSKIKMLSWINSSIRYNASFQWLTAPPVATYMGNTIQNNNGLNINAQFNFISLYNQSKRMQNVLRGKRANYGLKKKKKKKPDVKDSKVKDKKDEEKISAPKNEKQTFSDKLLYSVMMLKNATFTLTQNKGTVIPGFNQKVEFFGYNFKNSVPNPNFILGAQDKNLRYDLAQKGYLTNDPRLNNFYQESINRNFNGGVTIEPIKYFRIELKINQVKTDILSSNFKFDNTINDWKDEGLTRRGTYTSSYIFLNTLFTDKNKSNASEVFNQFMNNRFVVAQRLQNGDGRINSKVIDPKTGFPIGYTKDHQDVLISSFLASYTGKNNATSKLGAFPKIPLPNWTINYNGLANMEALQDIFSSFTIRHGYNSVYSVSGYTRNLQYEDNSTAVQGDNIASELIIPAVTVTESFSPLIGINASTTNGWTLGFDYKKTRNVNLFVANFNLTENKLTSWTISAGKRANNFKLPFKYKGSPIILENDLNLKLDISLNDNRTLVRQITDNTEAQPSTGSRTFSIRANIDYQINSKINLNLYYDRNQNIPVTSTYYETRLTNFGLKLRYTLQ